MTGPSRTQRIVAWVTLAVWPTMWALRVLGRVEFMKWQRIETAPKDGTEILAHVLHNETRVVWWDGQGWRIPGVDGVLHPTHWTTIPELPQSIVDNGNPTLQSRGETPALREALQAVADALLGAHGFAPHDDARINEAYRLATAALAPPAGRDQGDAQETWRTVARDANEWAEGLEKRVIELEEELAALRAASRSPEGTETAKAPERQSVAGIDWDYERSRCWLPRDRAEGAEKGR